MTQKADTLRVANNVEIPRLSLNNLRTDTNTKKRFDFSMAGAIPEMHDNKT